MNPHLKGETTETIKPSTSIVKKYIYSGLKKGNKKKNRISNDYLVLLVLMNLSKCINLKKI